jgi:hypothetical protein
VGSRDVCASCGIGILSPAPDTEEDVQVLHEAYEIEAVLFREEGLEPPSREARIQELRRQRDALVSVLKCCHCGGTIARSLGKKG